MISKDGKTLHLHAELGVPKQLFAVQRVLTQLGLGDDDGMFLEVLAASCAGLDPLHLCRMFRNRTLKLQGGTPPLRVASTVLIVPVRLEGATVAELYVSLVTNDIAFGWRRYLEEQETPEPEMEMLTEQLQASELFTWLEARSGPGRVRLSELQAMFDRVVAVLLQCYANQASQPMNVLT